MSNFVSRVVQELLHFELNLKTETEMLPFWRNFRHWLYWELCDISSAASDQHSVTLTFLFQWFKVHYKGGFHDIFRGKLEKILLC